MFKQETNQPVIVLGKTFTTEDERREYFRNELRKKLPELKKMEGFPIGEDDDIINLSDPPYYTACPNPWLNDFIAEWENEKKELEKQGKRIPDSEFQVFEPYAADVSEGKNNAIYTAHSYHTKVPHLAIMRYLLHYTQPGDTVLDAFGGTGMTALAGQFCELPNGETKTKLETEWQRHFQTKPIWGARKTLLCDLSPLASFIAYNYNTPHNPTEFDFDGRKIIDEVKKELSWMYETKHIDGRIGSVNYTVWSEVFACSNCGNEIVYWDNAVDENIGVVKTEFNCQKCQAIQNKNLLTRFWTTTFDSAINKSIKHSKFVPVLIHYTFNSRSYLKSPDIDDYTRLRKIDETSIPTWFPTMRMPEGDESRRNDRAGITHTHHFYTKRNLIALSLFYSKLPLNYKVLFTSMLNRSSKMVMTVMSNYFAQRKGKTVGGWAGKPMNGTLYIPSISTEVSVLESINSRFKTILKLQISKKYFRNSNYAISTSSATQLDISNNSVDYIFTDPPFGANIMYSELNFIAESWMRVITHKKDEAIENKSQGKTLFEYQNLMTKSFSEYFRILKPGRWMTVEFSNTSAAVWNSIQTSLQRAGFIIANVSALDKKQGSFKAVSTVTAVKQDLVISCYKPSFEFDKKINEQQYSVIAIWEFVNEHLNHLPIHLTSGNSTTVIIERSPKILFDRLIAFYVQRAMPVPIDAGKFQQGLRERFIERDGMFFTNEQVHEYDRKKAEVPNFVQLSIFVANEQDAIYWLRNVLKSTPKTEQDLHPLWMKEVAGNMRKGDILPEMRTILEENFLKNDRGQWYLPDPENEADLEKLRTRRLLRLFDTYKEEASKPRGKVKEARVEALRAGFKQCYQDKDFKTIVQVGDRIPNNLLMEDEVLLQFYDIASTRI